ncbi:MAG: hypothetical protein C0514_02805 [Candidatus Puniceispirillum sp.]|nr:hypothetical protein [Candidatus Puniceispirillum sp.]
MKKTIPLFFVLLGACSAHASEFGPDDIKLSPARAAQKELQDQLVKQSVRETYARMNSAWSYPEGEDSDKDDKMVTHAKVWTIDTISHTFQKDGQTIVARMRTFVLKEEPHTILEALDELVASPAQVDCTLALMTAQAFALRALMGDTLFRKYAVLLHGSLSNKTTFFSALPRHFLRLSHTPIRGGHFYHITNVPQYGALNPYGYDAGHNVFCLGENLHIGFGPFFRDGPKREQDIAEHLRENYRHEVLKHKGLNAMSKHSYHKHRTEHQKLSTARISFRFTEYTEEGLAYHFGNLMLEALDF